MAQGFLEDVLAGRPTARAAGDHAFQSLQAGPRLLLDRLPRGQRRSQSLDDRLGVREPLPQLGGLGLLGLTARQKARLELRDIMGLRRRLTDQAPDQRADETHPDHEAYQKQREQQF